MTHISHFTVPHSQSLSFLTSLTSTSAPYWRSIFTHSTKPLIEAQWRSVYEKSKDLNEIYKDFFPSFLSLISFPLLTPTLTKYFLVLSLSLPLTNTHFPFLSTSSDLRFSSISQIDVQWTYNLEKRYERTYKHIWSEKKMWNIHEFVIS